MNKNNYAKHLTDLFHSSPISKTMGMTLEYNDQYQAVFKHPYHPGFDHALHSIHGGVFSILLDNAGWFTAAMNYQNWIVTTEFNTKLLEVVTKEDLYSIGKIVRFGKRLTVCEMEVRTEANQLVAIGSGSFMVTNQEIKL
jgi:uncharacterized protein (TIGR00369 family)